MQELIKSAGLQTIFEKQSSPKQPFPYDRPATISKHYAGQATSFSNFQTQTSQRAKNLSLGTSQQHAKAEEIYSENDLEVYDED